MLFKLYKQKKITIKNSRRASPKTTKGMTVVTTVTQSCSDAQSGGNQEKLGQVLFFTPLESMLLWVLCSTALYLNGSEYDLDLW